MSQVKQICGVRVSSLGILTVLFYIIDKSTAALDGYVAGEDYPAFTEVPKGLSFTCDDKIPGYYADPETMCQVWHWCVPTIGGNLMYSFVCGIGTVFNQKTRVCDWFFKLHKTRWSEKHSVPIIRPQAFLYTMAAPHVFDSNVDCQNSASYYGINEDLYKDASGNYINGKK